MLGKPCNGWVNVYCGTEKLGCASYIEDVAEDLLDAFIAYFNQDHVLSFAVCLDAEEDNFGLMEFDGSLYAIHDGTIDGKLEIHELEPELLGLLSFANAFEMLHVLAEELVSDVRENIDAWADWGYDDFSEEDKKQRAGRLLEKCRQCEESFRRWFDDAGK